MSTPDFIPRAGGYVHASRATSSDQPIGHPRDFRATYPHHSRYQISGAPWAADLAKFQALVTAGKFHDAACLADGGFLVRLDDVPAEHREAFRTWVRRQRGAPGSPGAEWVSGEGW
jgi:hypothetical protein